jgi:predicted Zn-dependent protease with MMP-like domain
MQMTREEFEAAVSEALDRMPVELAELMDNLVVQVHEIPARQTLLDLELDPRRQTLFGLYTGVPLDARGGGYGNVLPDVVELYRRPLMAACDTRTELVRQIQLTLLHEIGHHFGFSDAEMDAWDDEFAGLDDAE